MLLRVQLLYYKFDLFLARINKKLPRFLHITKYTVVTTFLAAMLSTSVVYAAESTGDEKDNLYMFTRANLTDYLVHGNDMLMVTSYGGTEESEGAINRVNGLISTTYKSTNKVSGVGYVYATLKNDAKIVRPAYAQSSGFRTLNGVMEIWKVIRNISLSLVLAFGMIMAIMILFRVRQGQGYVTILNSLSRMVIAILLIIFSYSIAGFAIDVANLGTNLVVTTIVGNETLFKTNVSSRPLANFPGEIDIDGDGVTDTKPGEYNVFRLLANIVNFETWMGARTCRAGETSPDSFDFTPYDGQCPVTINDIVASPTMIPALDTGLSLFGGDLGDLTIDLILKVLVLIVVIKVFLALMMAFIKIILRTITAPIEFLFVSFSGMNAFTGWIRGILSSALTFPLAMALMLVAAVVSHQFTAPYYVQDNLTGIDRAPVLLSHSVANSPDGAQLSYLGGIIGIGIISFIPSVTKLLEQMLKTEGMPALAGVGEELKKAAAKIPVVGGLATSI